MQHVVLAATATSFWGNSYEMEPITDRMVVLDPRSAWIDEPFISSTRAPRDVSRERARACAKIEPGDNRSHLSRHGITRGLVIVVRDPSSGIGPAAADPADPSRAQSEQIGTPATRRRDYAEERMTGRGVDKFIDSSDEVFAGIGHFNAGGVMCAGLSKPLNRLWEGE
jgi:hypothetical protein